ncbi:hypothetical protein ACWDR1_21195 [Streptosporangium sandarakinum]
MTGWEITHVDDDTAYLGDGPIQLAFQRVEDYRGLAGPTRPSTPTSTSRSPTPRSP